MKIHLIAIGGSIMHNLALSLQQLGHVITGSDDVIYDPAKTRLFDRGLLPTSMGWDENNIREDLDLVILGMHAKKDNIELLAAQNAGIPIKSFPEFIAQQAQAQKRIVVAGSHGKTTTTSMIMHLMKENHQEFDFLVGAQLKGYDVMVQLSDALTIIIEGDEYLSSALDRRSKFLHYKPDVCVLTGLDWDHVNVFSTYEEYLDAFRKLLSEMNEDAILIYNQYDPFVVDFVKKMDLSCVVRSYAEATWEWKDNQWNVRALGGEHEVDIPGEHNIVNMMGALQATISGSSLPVNKLLLSMTSFEMPDKRLNVLLDTEELLIFRDFAHAPSKVRASVHSMAPYLTNRRLIVVMEIHTYSSLSKEFLPLYKDSLQSADEAWIYYNPEALKIKKMEALSPHYIRTAFNAPKAHVQISTAELWAEVSSEIRKGDVVLLMSSSNFGGIQWLDLEESI